jgi:thiol-disulfide isomerase/thioredoxin
MRAARYHGGVRAPLLNVFSHWLVAVAALAALGALGACSSTELPKAPPKLTLVPAPAGEVPEVVRQQTKLAAARGGQLLVYVGATWCEPCQDFHKAAASGALDQVFPGLVLLEFDADRDGDRLAAAGYHSKLVPLFVRPAQDGSSSGQQTEGVRRGSDAVADLTPRLRGLLN